MTDNEWQNRVLSDEQIQQVLAQLSPLEGMTVLQRQYELRASEVVQQIAEHHSADLATPEPVAPETATASENAADAQAVSNAVPVAGDLDIVNNLNALFGAPPTAAAQPAAVTPPPAPAAPQVLADELFTPRHVEAETKSQFIPTFSNPLPDTENVEVITPMTLTAPRDVPVDAAPEVPAEAVVESAVESVDEDNAAPSVKDTVTEISTAETPTPESDSTVVMEEPNTEIPSAEEAVLSFEEHHYGDPGLVDSVILNSGGEDDDALVALVQDDSQSDAPVKTPAASSGRSGVFDLLATWNGTGTVLFLTVVGFVAASNGYQLASILVGAFAALAIAGFGFGTAALAARRGRQPQSTTSRAAFGVRGAGIPLTAIIVARFAATGLATVGTVMALRGNFNILNSKTVLAGYSWDNFSLALVAVLAVSTLFTILGTLAHLPVTRFVSLVSIGAVMAIIGLAIAGGKVALSQIGSLDSGHALAVASVVIIFLSVVWGTSATDETPNLKSRLIAPKLLAAGVLNFVIVGSLAVAAGYLYATSSLGHEVRLAVSSLFGVLAIFALSHQIKRSADSFRGFGLNKTRWWVVLLSSLVVAAAALVSHLLVAEQPLIADALSLLPVAGVPTVAWLAIFGMDTVLRTEDYHEVSLLRNYGFYGKVRGINLVGWFLAVAAGFGFLDSSVPGFTWLGYIARPLHLSLTGLQADMGVWIAFLVGLCAPLMTIPAIRDQESEFLALQARHSELVNITGEI